jgi:Uncharacterized protein conserved in bacteria (DUF2252)
LTPSTAAEPRAGPRGPAQGRVPHPSVTERAARGKATRASVPRSSHADWEPSAARMPASPFAFSRGAAALMAGDLAATPHSPFPAQLCGDAHLSNFGGFAAPDRELVFDINDFVCSAMRGRLHAAGAYLWPGGRSAPLSMKARIEHAARVALDDGHGGRVRVGPAGLAEQCGRGPLWFSCPVRGWLRYGGGALCAPCGSVGREKIADAA